MKSRSLPGLAASFRSALAFLLAFVAANGALGAADTTSVPRPLVVAVRESPPFALRDANGDWEGLSVELWERVASTLGRDFRWQELPLSGTLAALDDGSVDVAIAALTITPDREQHLDFSHPYLVSGLTLAYPADRGGWLDTLRSFFSLEFLSAVASLMAVLLVAGVAVWLFERRRNPDDFGGTTMRGLGSGFWWSAVTMTTVGYGDKAPKTVGGRVVGLIWMFVSVIVIASFTASIAASVTVNRLGSDLLRGSTLDELEIGAVRGSAAAAWADSMGYRTRLYPSVEEATAAVGTGVDVVLHDEPILRYLQRNLQQDHEQIELAPRSLVRDDYGFGLPAGSELREPINRALLRILHEPTWREIRRRYLGAQEEGG